MTLEGRVTVDALLHDKEGSTDLRVISLAKSWSIGAGRIAGFVTGTLAATQTASIDFNSGLRDAAGNVLSFENVGRVVFSWSGGYSRVLGGDSFSVQSINGELATSACDEAAPLTIGQGSDTGTYSIVFIGTPQ